MTAASMTATATVTAASRVASTTRMAAAGSMTTTARGAHMPTTSITSARTAVARGGATTGITSIAGARISAV
jgi:hypothetical protein